MTVPAVGSSTPFKKSSQQCPNCSTGAHNSVEGDLPPWTQAEVRSALATIDISSGSPLCRSARFHASRALHVIEADDLLQKAILLALTMRKCSSKICIVHFLTGIMWSVASGIIQKQESQMAEPGARYPLDIEQVRSEAPSPAEELDCRRRSQECQLALDTIAEGRPTATAVIDGIGLGHQGEALAEFAGIDVVELSTVRRLIKRRAASIRSEFDHLDDAA